MISHQVIEHVPDAQYGSYYAEQGRVLVPGEIVLAQVPHRLVPYNSHSRIWFLHMLSETTARRVMPMAGRQWPDHLHLRWPWAHARMTRCHIGPISNRSGNRLIELVKIDHYDGPKGLRMLLGGLCRLPLLGPSMARLLSQFVLMETVAIREPTRGKADRQVM